MTSGSSRSLKGVLVVGGLAVLALAGCKDSGGGSTTILGADGSVATPDLGSIATGGHQGGGGVQGQGGIAPDTDALPLIDQGATGGSANGGQMGTGGQVNHECDPGRIRCLTEGDSTIEQCADNGTWGLDVCPDGGPCYGDTCLPSAAACTAGQKICLTDTQPGHCDPGNAWIPDAACADGEVCSNGQCQSAACALADVNRSYLGCNYWAVELPNLSLRDLGGATPDAPIGVVVANADEVNPAHVSVYGPDSQLAALVGRITIQPPPADLGQPSFDPVTVQSEVRDSTGHVTENNVAQANSLEVPPGGTATFLLPRVTHFDDSSVVAAQAFNIRTDSPIAAYQFNPLCCNYTFSNDASLLIPTSALGTDYRFLGVPAWTSLGAEAPSPAGVGVVATEDNTQVTIALPRSARISLDRRGRIHQAGGSVTVTLNAHEAAIIQTEGGGFGSPSPDLSGSKITSNSPIAVFSTHQCSFYPEAIAACDHLEEELIPAATLGRQYVMVPPKTRGRRQLPTEVIYWKILSTEADTRITLSEPFADLHPVAPGFTGVPNCRDFLEPDGVTLVLGENGYCEFGTQLPVAASSNNLIEVMGIMVGQDATSGSVGFGDHAGDPSIYLLAPDLQYRDDYLFLTPGTYANDYVTITADADTVLTLDGQPVNLGDATPVPGTSRVYKHVTLEDGAHRLHGDKPFGIVVYAFDDYVSYAFTGGLNLHKR